jgi:hypothetical protein
MMIWDDADPVVVVLEGGVSIRVRVLCPNRGNWWRLQVMSGIGQLPTCRGRAGCVESFLPIWVSS